MNKWRREIDENKKTFVGLNKFRIEEKEEIPPFAVDLKETREKTLERLRQYKANRDNDRVQKALKELKETMRSYENVEQAGILMPALLDAARAKCTLAEMMGAIIEATGGRTYSTA